MEKDCGFDITHDFFFAKKVENVAVIRFKGDLLFRAIDLKAKTSLFDCLKRISEDDAVRAVLIIGSPGKTGRKEYTAFYHHVSKAGIERYAINRMYNSSFA